MSSVLTSRPDPSADGRYGVVCRCNILRCYSATSAATNSNYRSDDPLLVVVELRLEMLLLGARLALHILLQHALVLLLLHLHLILHPLLAGDDVPRLIGIIGGVDGCARTLSGSSAARNNSAFMVLSSRAWDHLSVPPFQHNNDF
jgi:hypothetical protein